MKWLIIIGIASVFLYFILKKGNDKFWKYVNNNPFKAYEFFMNDDCWLVIHPNEYKSKPKDGGWSGPFFVPVPGIGRLKIYGKEGEFEKRQQEFIEMIESR
jgi:hypothetical protein